MSRFWRTWMTVWCWAVGLFGAVLAAAGIEGAGGPAVAIYGLLSPEPIELAGALRFSVALMGAVTLGWSLTLGAAIAAANQLGPQGRDTWRMMTLSVVGWYVIDSSLSVVTGFGLNAVPNSLLLAGYLLPVIRSGMLRDRPLAA
jgi:hypothetical protein